MGVDGQGRRGLIIRGVICDVEKREGRRKKDGMKWETRNL